jgi:hypothetical protein
MSKRSHKTDQGFSYYFCLMIEGSGSESIPLTNGSGSATLLEIIDFLRHYRYHTYRTVVKRVGAVGDLDLNVIDRNVILGRGHVLHATAYLAHFPSIFRRQNFRQSFRWIYLS